MALCLLAFFCNAGQVGQESVTIDIQAPKTKSPGSLMIPSLF